MDKHTVSFGPFVASLTTMRYTEFREGVEKSLRRNTAGRTWEQLRAELKLERRRACPEWTKALEKDIGLKRVKGAERALVWRV